MEVWLFKENSYFAQSDNFVSNETIMGTEIQKNMYKMYH